VTSLSSKSPFFLLIIQFKQDYSKIGLSSTIIASSFGKVIYKSQKLDRGDVKPEDMANSLLRMVSNNIGQIAYLNAMRFGLKRIYFGGFFIRNNPMTMAKISFAINFWSKGHMKVRQPRPNRHFQRSLTHTCTPSLVS